MGLIDFIKKQKIERSGMYIDISRSHTAKVIEEKNRIASNAEKVEHLLLLSEQYIEINEQLSDILINIKYSNPVVNEDIVSLDMQISAKLDDLTLMLSKSKIRSDLSVIHCIRDIKELIHKREMKE